MNFQTFLIRNIAQVDGVQAIILKQFQAVIIIANPSLKLKEAQFIHDIYAFINSLITELQRDKCVLSLNELRIVAQNVVDIEGDESCLGLYYYVVACML